MLDRSPTPNEATQTVPPGRVAGTDDGPPAGAPRLPDYEITGRLGEGGMGVVWRARQRSTNRDVALKVLSAATTGSKRARARFEREVELAARLEHPHIARVYDAGVADDQPYYAMQLVEGVPLDVYVRGRALGRDAIVRLMKTVCEAVQHAHQRGIIHRDLKPSNIMVAAGDQPVVLDFGLAKATELDAADATTVSIEGQIAGTPAYMAPEQASGRTKDISTRSDVYALGVILYRLLTGEFPHDVSGSSLDVLRRIVEQEVRRPRAAAPDASRIIDRELETLLLKALAKEPDRRYETAGALAADLGNYLDGEPLAARRPTATYVLRKRLRRHRVPVAAVLALLLLAAGLGGWSKLRPTRYPLDSYPTGAAVLVNGKVKSGCTMTPCFVDLPYGTHEIRLSLPGHEDAVRRITVDWGRANVLATAYAAEPVTLVPTERYVELTTDPAGDSVTIRDAATGEPVGQWETPVTVKLAAGKYVLEHAGRRQPMEVLRSVTPLKVSLSRDAE